MPKIETIPASEAPEAPRKMSAFARDFVEGVNRLKRDEVLRLEPDPGKSIRGLKTSVGRVASNHKLSLESWTDEEQTALYVKKA